VWDTPLPRKQLGTVMSRFGIETYFFRQVSQREISRLGEIMLPSMFTASF
jgi:hypothetical protein